MQQPPEMFRVPAVDALSGASPQNGAPTDAPPVIAEAAPTPVAVEFKAEEAATEGEVALVDAPADPPSTAAVSESQIDPWYKLYNIHENFEMITQYFISLDQKEWLKNFRCLCDHPVHKTKFCVRWWQLRWWSGVYCAVCGGAIASDTQRFRCQEHCDHDVCKECCTRAYASITKFLGLVEHVRGLTGENRTVTTVLELVEESELEPCIGMQVCLKIDFSSSDLLDAVAGDVPLKTANTTDVVKACHAVNAEHYLKELLQYMSMYPELLHRHLLEVCYSAEQVTAAIERKRAHDKKYFHSDTVAAIHGVFDEENPAVSFTVSLVPLIGSAKVPGLPAAMRAIEHWVDRQGDEKFKSDAEKEVARVIGLYTIESKFYNILNELLRSEDRFELRKYWFKYLRLLQQALYDHRQPGQKTLYRGIRILDLAQKYPKFYGEERVGKPGFVWWSFTSCSANREVIFNKGFLETSGPGTLFIITTEHATDIQYYSTNQMEEEWLLPAGCPLKVTKVHYDKGVCVVELIDDDQQTGEEAPLQ